MTARHLIGWAVLFTACAAIGFSAGAATAHLAYRIVSRKDRHQ